MASSPSSLLSIIVSELYIYRYNKKMNDFEHEIAINNVKYLHYIS